MSADNTVGDAAAAASTPSLVELLGPTLIKDAKGKQTVKTESALKSKDFVLLYFSASWCPPCQAFSPMLIDFYKKAPSVLKKHGSVEVIYISSDSSVPEFEGYFGKMPWLSLPIDSADIKNRLAKLFQIRGIPALIALNKDGLFVTDQARNEITACMKESNTDAAMINLLATWKSTTPVPPAEAQLEGASGGSASGLTGIFMSLLKNPASIFALLYFVKWAMRQYKTLMASSSGDDEAAAMMTGGDEAPMDDGQTEF